MTEPKSPEDSRVVESADEARRSPRSSSEGHDEIATRAGGSVASAPAGTLALVLTGNHKGTSKVVGGRLTIGKAADNDLVLSDDTVSRHHCEIVRAPDGLHVRDLDSTNGTKIDGTRIREAMVQTGSVLKVGEVELQFKPTVARVEVLPSEKSNFGPAIGQSFAMRTIFGVLERIAPTDATVLLEGETGTGKDVLARAIWSASQRANKPFLVVDCGAVTYSLIESELFGHERGAFTGAVSARQGAFELAEGGTVFLDEIGELPVDVQPKLLRVLETREFRRVGGNKTLQSNVRVIAATKRDLQREVAAGKFREDLYFRLAVVPVTVPPLRARRDDIPALVQHMLKASGGAGLTVPPETMQALAAHDWPGNIRELRNILERSIYMAQATGSTEINMVTLPSAQSTDITAFHFEPEKSYRETRAKYDGEFERRYVKWLLGRHNGNISAAAREAKMDRKHLHDMAKKHGLRGHEAEES
ncbi:Nitrogenase (molybdenum-iron)-specific transcriptional regulator NifA [Labilithrix luteola]|uniref:Nitrogenase (Molybdenum-iron)-specific transcriptional regulator NifA n=1 Tax=Labilithrix luteola TaxID=1391654 RepID=A0A0K1QA38_9BACT|nr:sigma 54-interacting transcriptional regulator [Labilithrix luteola]AKV02265.1 Nitrogenase (molybdenum-iron)-specific transcriptional regulator NifA [Labilithrix luteola]